MIDPTYELKAGDVIKHDDTGRVYDVIAIAEGKHTKDWMHGVVYQSESNGTWYWRSINSINENFSLFFEDTAG